MNVLEKTLYRELYRKSFYEFVKDFWSEADPSKLVDGKLIQLYCEIFQYLCKPWVGYEEINVELPKLKEDDILIDVRGNKNKIIINVPPRHSKSMIFNVLGPTWIWSYFPIKAASISHTGGLAKKMNMKRQSLISSERYKEIYPDIKIITDSNTSLIDSRGGELYSLNKNAFTGYGGDIIINDDLTNAETARKDMEEMNNSWEYYRNTMPSRINDINKCIILNIQQRLAPNDVTGRILSDSKLSKNYIHLVLPAKFDRDTYAVCPISGDILVWKKGEYLWPERFGNYESLRDDVGEVIWKTQYLQNPTATDKTVFKEDMLVLKDKNEVPGIEYADMIYASHDFPVKDKEKSDNLGSVLGYKIGATLYIIDCLEKKMGFTAGVNYVRQLDSHYLGSIQIIEDKANGSPIIEQLQDEIPGIQAYNPGTNSKVQRAESSSLYMQNVVFVKTKFNKFTNTYELSEPLKNLIQRLLDFPFVKHDDIVDAFTMLVLFVFMDRRYSVYGRSFNDYNICDISQFKNLDYSTIFFNREGDIWKALEISVLYGVTTKLVVKKEIRFKSSVEEGLLKLKEFSNGKNIFIDCSESSALRGMYSNGYTIERYEIEDFEQSVAQVNLAFSKKLILIDKNCKLCVSDIDTFKFSKTKDETVKYKTTKDGFVSCLRTALKYYGGIV